MAQQPTSLLSLPDELLVHIFDDLARPLRGGNNHPLLPFTRVCRRVRKTVRTILYSDIILGPDADAMSRFQAAVQQNPSIGQLVGHLTIYNADLAISRPSDPRRQLRVAPIPALPKLKELAVVGVTTDDASAVLAALPAPSLRFHKMRLGCTSGLVTWRELWAHLSRFPELRVLRFAYPLVETVIAPRLRAHPRPIASLPHLVELHITDFVLIMIFRGAALSLQQTLPGLRELHITMTRSNYTSDVAAILSQSPSSLTTLKILLDNRAPDAPSRYLAALPPLRHLGFGPRTVIEAELLAYLPSATTLESIGFDLRARATDGILQALTGAARPPQLRRIRLDHVSRVSLAKVEEIFKRDQSRYWHAFAHRPCDNLGPRWTADCTALGLRLAVADAHANGIEVSGSALGCIDWDTNYEGLLVDYMMEYAHRAGTYNNAIKEFGEEVAVAWLEQHAPHTVSLFRAQYMGDFELDDDGGPE